MTATPLSLPKAVDQFPFDNSYVKLPDRFYAKLPPDPVKAPRLIKLNTDLAEELGLDARALSAPDAGPMFAGNILPEGADPIATAYAGHQFGGFTPQLGDGRAILLGEIVGPDNIRRDIQLKGSGRTPFSRGGDGRAALGPVLREYVVSEGMHALGIPTTRALAAVTTGNTVTRETYLPGAILTRVAQSHLRVGTFQYFAARRDLEALKLLADHVIARHYPDAAQDDHPYAALLTQVIARQAALVAQWLSIGFIHGVMNTDNTTVSGETIDYGPCAFMDGYDPNQVFSSIDHMGRYAYANQPGILQWNLAQLAQCLLPLMAETPEDAIPAAQAAIDAYPEQVEAHRIRLMGAKLGLETDDPKDLLLAEELMTLMAQESADFTLTFRHLANLLDPDLDFPTLPEAEFKDKSAFASWEAAWRARLATAQAADGMTDTARAARMRQINPALIPRNHLVEEVIRAAEDNGDFAPFEQLVALLRQPYREPVESPRFRQPPRPDQVVHETFCGT